MSRVRGELFLESAFWEVREYMNRVLKQEYLIDGLLLERSQALLWAPTGHLKSFVVIDMACHVATGQAYHGRPVKQGEVVYVAAEAPQEIGKRILAWEDYYDLRTGITMHVRNVQLHDTDAMDLLADHIESKQGRVSLVIFDTAERVSYGTDENAPSSVNERVNRPIDLLRKRTGVTTLLVHHANQGAQTPRGCTAWQTPNDTIFRVDSQFVRRRNTDEPTKATLQVVKQRGDSVSSVELRPHKVGVKGDPRGTLVLTPFEEAEVAVKTKPMTTDDKLIDFFRERQDVLTTKEVADGLYGGKSNSAHQALKRAKEKGLFTKEGTLWRLAV